MHTAMRSRARQSLRFLSYVLTASAALATEVCLAQQAKPAFEVLPFENRIRESFTVTQMLGGDKPLDEKVLAGYLNEFIFAEMTQPENLVNIPNLRIRFYRNFRRPRGDVDPKALEALNRITIDTMKRLITGNFHPAVRFNAVLILGDLDQKPAVELGVDKSPPVPLSEARKLLLFIVQDPRQIFSDSLKAGALIGLRRHGDHRMTIDDRDAVTKVMLDLLAQKEPPEHRDAQPHTWMRRKAAETLGVIQHPGRSNQVVDGLLEIINDKESPLELRCTAAQALGQLKGDVKVDAPAVALTLAELAIETMKDDVALAAQYDTQVVRRLAVARLSDVRVGLSAPLSQLSTQSVAADVDKELGEAIAMLTQSDENRGFHENLAVSYKRLAAAIGKTPAAETLKPEEKKPAETEPKEKAKPPSLIEQFE